MGMAFGGMKLRLVVWNLDYNIIWMSFCGRSCLYTFRYVGKQNIAIKMWVSLPFSLSLSLSLSPSPQVPVHIPLLSFSSATSGLRQSDHPFIQPQQSLRTAPAPPTGKEKASKKHSTGSLILSSPASSLMLAKGKPSRSTSMYTVIMHSLKILRVNVSLFVTLANSTQNECFMGKIFFHGQSSSHTFYLLWT